MKYLIPSSFGVGGLLLQFLLLLAQSLPSEEDVKTTLSKTGLVFHPHPKLCSFIPAPFPAFSASSNHLPTHMVAPVCKGLACLSLYCIPMAKTVPAHGREPGDIYEMNR
jgi:hypothetical protein